MDQEATRDPKPSTHFVAEEIRADLASGKVDHVQTRWPPEPNGYMHIGHAKACWINFSLAEEFGGVCNLRMDDTNPEKEEMRFVEGFEEDIRWLGYSWGKLCYASDYFEQLYAYALQLIEMGKAFVCELTPEEMRAYRGNLKVPGRESPFRERPLEENRRLFEAMRAGEFPDGRRTLRAKIDMAAPNMNLRDPVLYRIKRMHHFRTGDTWCIYPSYDWAHGQSDSIEGVTHSLCSLEFEDHRPLYDWFIQTLGIFPSRQIEFARLNLTHTVMSKRYLRQLVEDGHVAGWDDPRMPTVRGMRRRGYTPASIRAFNEKVGVTKFVSKNEPALLEFCVRQDLEGQAARRMVVLDPLKVTITNFPAGEVKWFEGPNHPADANQGTRQVPLTREIYIEREDFLEDAPRKFFRLAPGREVRLRYCCYITCTEVVKDADGEIVELKATYDPESLGGSTPDGRKVKGTIHFASADPAHHVPLEARLYGPLFLSADPTDQPEGKTFLDDLNPDSLSIATAYGEPALTSVAVGETVQFERKGYFCLDPESDPAAGKFAFNRTVTLKDSHKPSKSS